MGTTPKFAREIGEFSSVTPEGRRTVDVVSLLRSARVKAALKTLREKVANESAEYATKHPVPATRRP